MKFIKILGSKLYPVIKQKKNRSIKKDLTITNIKVELENNQLLLCLIGDNLKEDLNYEWTISFDNSETIYPSSIGTTLILNTTNTLNYINSEKTTIVITTDNYISPIFEI